MIPSINQISLADIEKNIQSEMQYFRYGQSALGEEYALELLRRALPSKNTDVHPDKAAAQEALISLYTKLIIANIRGSAINPDEIEDVTQQVWLNFWQSAQMGRAYKYQKNKEMLVKKLLSNWFADYKSISLIKASIVMSSGLFYACKFLVLLISYRLIVFILRLCRYEHKNIIRQKCTRISRSERLVTR